ncbi:hypothetical protein SBA2_130008 [Acidobacteriia bacterium SbA2]|nr:hypothetical protein SBA2_130008 [Acidobacteriia bacterium SbA2]
MKGEVRGLKSSVAAGRESRTVNYSLYPLTFTRHHFLLAPESRLPEVERCEKNYSGWAHFWRAW